jgi:ankyrin repeat protein
LEDEENQTKATHRKKVLGQYDITGMNALGMALQRPSIPDNLLSRIVSNLGSDIATLKNSMGETALHHALLFKDKPNLEHILLLLEAGADPNALDDIFGFAPMHVCAFMGFSTQALEWNYAMTLLLEQGGDQTLTEGRKGWSWKTIAEFEATWNQGKFCFSP